MKLKSKENIKEKNHENKLIITKSSKVTRILLLEKCLHY